MRPTLRSTRSDHRVTVTQGLGQQNTSIKQAQARHRTSTAQLNRLEELFKEDTYPSRQCKKDVAAELGMEYKTVTIWFQNKRQTSRRSQSRLDAPSSPKKALTRGRPKADSCLRRVSSPLHNTTLETPDHNSRAPHSPSKGDGVTAVAPKAITKNKPLLESLNTLTSKSKLLSETKDAKDEEGNVRDNGPHHLSASSSDKPAPDVRHGHIVEAENSRDRLIQRKGLRTLEWACERQAKRRESSKNGTKLDIGSEEGGRSASDNLRTDSALSLLSLASLTYQRSPKDVMWGASLLLSFKHSWDRR
ncbi:homeobox domain-containing protein [Melanogaster broomeanus]|nr:homeobox domain-containing protein [Melanogaster broomeanus]